ncbi:MAG: Verru_Chthon cassette protein C [Verrucomicrobiae bacterium]|nr:Verru_Chthon cassette protein C [Verrucomicrobiae bacterium]
MKTLNQMVPRFRRAVRSTLAGFTLVELLVAMSILSVLLLLLSQLLDQVQKSWNYSEGRVSQFREARLAFDLISKNLSQATLNTYWDLEYDRSTNTVRNYVRQSELHFATMDGSDLGSTGDGQILGHAIFFQAPLGFSNQYRNLSNLLTARGYYLVFGGDKRFKPGFIDAEERKRFRLMEYRPPAEENQIYIDGDEERVRGNKANYTDWYRYELEKFSNPISENIVAFVVAPRDSIEVGGESGANTFSRIAPDYKYDSAKHTNPLFVNQLPPLVRITMVAIDETAAVKMDATGGDPKNILPAGMFRNTSNFEKDVESVKAALSQKGFNHKVFSTLVAIRSAKWNTYVP